jgi:hypothetical protein
MHLRAVCGHSVLSSWQQSSPAGAFQQHICAVTVGREMVEQSKDDSSTPNKAWKQKAQ